MSNSIPFLETSTPSLLSMSHLSPVLQPVDSLDQEPPFQKKVETLALSLFEPETFFDDRGCMSLSTEELLGDNCLESPSSNGSLMLMEPQPELWLISDKEWALVEPLLTRKVESKGTPRPALNSILLMLINGISSNSLPANLNFAKKVSTYKYFSLWQENGTFEKVLILLREGAQGPSQLYYQDLLRRFQHVSTWHKTPLSIQMLKPPFGQVESGFQGLTDKEWTLVKPLLSKKVKSKGAFRSILNSIFLILKKETFDLQIPVNPNFSGKTTVHKNFRLWKESGILEKVLVRLVKGTQDPSQSHYQKLLENLQKAPFLQPIRKSTPKLRPLYTETKQQGNSCMSDEKGAFVDPSLDQEPPVQKKVDTLALSLFEPETFFDDQGCMSLSTENLLDSDYVEDPCSSLDTEEIFDDYYFESHIFPFLSEINMFSSSPLSHPEPIETNLDQTPPLSNALTLTETKPAFRPISDEEWALVEPLLRNEVKSRENPRSSLNSVLFMLINGASGETLPISPSFSKKVSAYKYFYLWQKDGIFEKALTLLEKGTEGWSQLYYRDLLKRVHKALNSQARTLSIRKLKPVFRPIEAVFQGLTDKEWALVEPLLIKKVKSKGAFRSTLNSIFFMLVNGISGAQIPTSPGFSRPAAAYKYLALWKQSGLLENVLIRLVEETRGASQSDYRKLLESLQKSPNLKKKRTSVAELKLKNRETKQQEL